MNVPRIQLRAFTWLAPAPLLIGFLALAWSGAAECDSGGCAQGFVFSAAVFIPLVYSFFVVLCLRLESHLKSRDQLTFARFLGAGVAISVVPFLVLYAVSIRYSFEIRAMTVLLAVAAIAAASVIALWWALRFGFHARPAASAA